MFTAPVPLRHHAGRAMHAGELGVGRTLSWLSDGRSHSHVALALVQLGVLEHQGETVSAEAASLRRWVVLALERVVCILRRVKERSRDALLESKEGGIDGQGRSFLDGGCEVRLV